MKGKLGFKIIFSVIFLAVFGLYSYKHFSSGWFNRDTINWGTEEWLAQRGMADGEAPITDDSASDAAAAATPEPTPEATPEPTPEPEKPADEPAQPEQPAKTGISTGMMLLIGIVVLVAGGAGYYVKIYKPKHELDDAEDWDDISFAGPEDEPVEEDFSELTAEEEAERRRRYEEDADEDEDMDGDSDAPVQ